MHSASREWKRGRVGAMPHCKPWGTVCCVLRRSRDQPAMPLAQWLFCFVLTWLNRGANQPSTGLPSSSAFYWFIRSRSLETTICNKPKVISVESWKIFPYLEYFITEYSWCFSFLLPYYKLSISNITCRPERTSLDGGWQACGLSGLCPFFKWGRCISVLVSNLTSACPMCGVRIRGTRGWFHKGQK